MLSTCFYLFSLCAAVDCWSPIHPNRTTEILLCFWYISRPQWINLACSNHCTHLCVSCLGAEAWRWPGSRLSLHIATSEESQIPGQKNNRFCHDSEYFPHQTGLVKFQIFCDHMCLRRKSHPMTALSLTYQADSCYSSCLHVSSWESTHHDKGKKTPKVCAVSLPYLLVNNTFKHYSYHRPKHH